MSSSNPCVFQTLQRYTYYKVLRLVFSSYPPPTYHGRDHISNKTIFFLFYIFYFFIIFIFFSFFFVFLYFCIFVPSTSNIHQRKQAAPKIWHFHRIHWRRNMLTEWIVVRLPTHENFDVRPLEIEFLKRWWW